MNSLDVLWYFTRNDFSGLACSSVKQVSRTRQSSMCLRGIPNGHKSEISQCLCVIQTHWHLKAIRVFYKYCFGNWSMYMDVNENNYGKSFCLPFSTLIENLISTKVRVTSSYLFHIRAILLTCSNHLLREADTYQSTDNCLP